MELSKREKLWVFWGYLVIFNGLQILISIGYVIIYTLDYIKENGGFFASDDVLLMEEPLKEYLTLKTPVVMMVSSIIILIIFYLILKKFLKVELKTFLGTKELKVLSVVGFIIMLVGNYFISSLYILLGIEGNSANQDAVVDLLVVSPLLMSLTVVLFIPIIEELMFRKVILEYFRKWGNIIGIGISSLLFGLMHVITGDIIFLPIYVIMGIVLGYIYLKSNRNIYVPIMAHALNNLLSVLLTLLIG
ncbi:CPBP family intramembrane glutamic endopeptidase [Mycoplasmatota bacterium zrk1]